MPTLNANPGDPNANTYATLAEAEAYVSGHTASPLWGAATPDAKTAALLEACRLIDACFNWTGGAATAAQALAWPRVGMASRNGYPIDPASIPQGLKDAQCELARQLIQFGDKTDDNDPQRLGITSLRAGPVSLAWQGVGAGSGSVDLRNADVLRQGPDFDWLWKAMPVAVRVLIVPSWYTRVTVSLPIILDAGR